MESVANSASDPVDVVASTGGGEGPDDSSLSEDQLLDKYTEPSATEGAPAEAEAGQQPPEAKPGAQETKAEATEQPEETKEPEPEEPFLQEPEPEDLKKAFKSLQKWHPQVAKTVRDAFYKAKAYSEVMTVPEARELRTLFPTVEDAKYARGSVADMLAADEILRTNPPALLDWLSQKDPRSFEGLVLAAPHMLYRSNPEAYREHISGPAVKNYLDFFQAQGQQSGNQDLVTAIEILREAEKQTLGAHAPGNRPQPQVDPAIAARLQELEAREAQAQTQSVETFKGSVDAAFTNALSAEVDNVIGRSGADLSPAAREEVRERILADAKDELLKDQVLQRRLEFNVNGGPRDANHQKQLVDLLVANGRRFIAPYASRHLSWMTKEILRADAGNGRPKSAAPPSRTAGGGVPSGGGGKQQLTQADYDKMTPDEIITAAAQGRL